MKIGVLDTVTSEPCKNCGGKGWIVDSAKSFASKREDAWLLCLDPKNMGCVETKPLDENLELEED